MDSTRTRGARLFMAIGAAVMVGAVAAAPAAVGRRAAAKLDRIVFSSNREGNFRIYTANDDGSNVAAVTTSARDDIDPDVSPDGRRIVFTRGTTSVPQPYDGELFVADIDGTDAHRLLGSGPIESDEVVDFGPAWSPDGKLILFSRQPLSGGGNPPTGASSLWVVMPDGSGLTMLAANGSVGSWSPDGKQVVYTAYRGSALELWTMAPDGSAKTLLSKFPGFSPRWSPDGRAITFSAFPAGSGEIYVMEVATMAIRQVTHNATTERFPSWSPDGGSVIYASSRDDPLCGLNGSPAGPLATCLHQLYETNLATGVERRVMTSRTSDHFPAYLPRRARGGH